MRAVLHRRYGPPSEVLTVEHVPDPVPGQGEVVVRVEAASLHPDVWHVVTGRPFVMRLMGSGLFRPRRPIPGTDVAGRVERLGPGTTRFRVGERVFGETVLGHQWKGGGAFAERVAVRELALEPIPEGIRFEAAATVPTSGMIAWQNLRGGDLIARGSRVLVNGAAGGVGLFALQIAKARGAHVTAVDAGNKLAMLRRAGADDVVDYEREPIGGLGGTFDVIVDVASTLRVADVRRLLPPTGHFVLIGHDHYGRAAGRWLGSMARFLRWAVLSLFVSQLRGVRAFSDRPGALAALSRMLESGALRPVVGPVYPLEDVRGAMAAMVEGANVGRIVLAP